MEFIKDHKKWDWNVILLMTFIIIAIIGGIYSTIKENSILNGECRYEIAIHSKTIWNRHFINSFYYNVNDIRYNSSSIGLIENNYEGKPYRYLIKYSVEKPSVSEVIMDVPIPRYVKSPPPGGWKEYPPSIKWKGAEFDWSYIEKK